jgi:DNA-directed RNA polymerase subunit beta
LKKNDGNKGVVSRVLPDDQMPKLENSDVKVDVIMNPLAIVNRLIPSVLYETELNFLAERVRYYCLNHLDDDQSRLNVITKFISFVNKPFSEFIARQDPKMYRLEIEKNGIYLQQQPFWDGVSLEGMSECYDFVEGLFTPLGEKLLYDVEVDGIKVDEPMVVGKMYLVKLKHEPKTKLSARSMSTTNQKEIPNKSNKINTYQAMYSNNPIRVGRMFAHYKLC